VLLDYRVNYCPTSITLFQWDSAWEVCIVPTVFNQMFSTLHNHRQQLKLEHS